VPASSKTAKFGFRVDLQVALFTDADRTTTGGFMARQVRLAHRDDADAIGQLLYAFNREFDEPAPEPPVLAARMRLNRQFMI
jgi:hypothetical protein